MPSLWSAFSSSSSASTSPAESPAKENSRQRKHLNLFRNLSGEPSGPKKRLTRQRKLRHASDDELGLRPKDRSQSLPVSPNSGLGSGSRSPHHPEDHWSKSAVPQPLPLPFVLDSLPRHNNDQNLPSPREGPSRGEGVSSGSVLLFGNPSQQTPWKNADYAMRRASKSPTYQRRGFPQELNGEGVGHNFRLNIPARSAPTSSFSSPARSPPRFGTADLFHPLFQTSSATEGPRCNRMQEPSPNVVSSRITTTPDHSPLQSPTSQSLCRNSRNPNGAVLHLHHKSLPESSTAWPEGINGNVYPLPLPPGVLKSSTSSPIAQSIDKPDMSSTKGQWQKGKLIGRGTYGSVYEATNCKTGALCAMKEVDLIPDDPKAAECIRQLEQEIKVLQQLEHKNIVQYYGSEIIDDRFCIYLEYVHPGSINKFVREHFGAMTESVVRNFTRHIVSGLAYLHSTKTIHRDIKGANLLVDSSGVVKLADFGLAKHLSGHAADLSLKGSPYWMAPEVLQAMMRRDANPELAFAVDIWSLGCTVIEMLTGKHPWSNFNEVQAMFNVLNRSPPIPETLSSEGKDFLRCCFQRKPEDRPSAMMLLEHPFLQNSHDQQVANSLQDFSGMKLSGSPKSPMDWRQHNIDLMLAMNSTRRH